MENPLSIGIAKKWEKISEKFFAKLHKKRAPHPKTRRTLVMLCFERNQRGSLVTEVYFERVLVGVDKEVALLSVNNRKYLIETTS